MRSKSDPHLAHYVVDPADLVPHIVPKFTAPVKRRRGEEGHNALTGGPEPGGHHRPGEARR